MSTRRFNLRVYGVCIRENQEVLLSRERYKDVSFVKFPGGGLEWGEGTKDCLIREFQEEFGIEITVGELFYLTDFFQLSAFSEQDQVISIYYNIALAQDLSGVSGNGDKEETLFWCPIADFSPEILKFPIDQAVAQILMNVYR